MKKYLKALVSGRCAAALALGCVSCGSSARKVLEYGLSDLAAADAEAEFLTDDHFEAWYQDICSQLKQYEG